MDQLEHVGCGECGEPCTPSAPDACPKCGSRAKHLKLTLHDEIVLRDAVRGARKDPLRPKKKRVPYEFFQGADLRVSEGDYVHKERIIDRDGDRYRELVVTDEGKVVIDVDHSLKRDHQAHGSAKFRVQPPSDQECEG